MLTSTTGLSFGAFVAGTGGSVVMSTQNARSKAGGVMLLSQRTGSAAQFIVTGNALSTFAITLPTSTQLLEASGHTMSVDQFKSWPNATGVIGAGGSTTLSVGATLTVRPSQPRGDYSGAFAVTVNYN